MNERTTRRWGRAARALALVALSLAGGWLLRGACAPQPEPAQPAADAAPAEPTIWTCSMHPAVRLDKFGLCPICAMDLIPLDASSAGDAPILTVTPAEAALMQVRTSPVERFFPTAELRMVGKLGYDETQRRYVTAWVPGRIDRLFVDYEGVEVREGDHLVDLYSPQLLAAQDELLQARRTIDEMSGSSLEVLRDSARSTFEAAHQKLLRWGMTEEQLEELLGTGQTSDHTTLYARRGGVVTEKLVKEGAYVGEGTRIYSIDDLSHLWVRFDAYESDLVWLHYGQEVEFETEAYPGERFVGKVAFLARELDPVTRTVSVRVNVPNEDGRLKPGMFVRGHVHARIAADAPLMDPELAGRWICPMHPEVVKDEAGSCDLCGMPLVTAESLGYAPADTTDLEPPLVVPRSAVLRTGRRAVVYVQVPDADEPTFEGREIVLGPRAGDVYIVLEGLKEGELVVTRGNFKIDSALELQAKPSMMSYPGDPRPGTAEESPFLQSPLPATAATLLERLWQGYSALRDALVADDAGAAREAFGVLASLADEPAPEGLVPAAADAWSLQWSHLAPITARVGAESGIEALREHFEHVDAMTAALVEAFGAPADAPLYRVHCPMAFDFRGASWLQADEDVLNPYFGAEMLRCGSVKGELPAGVRGE